jgi:orotate phosphoribosyltransferase
MKDKEILALYEKANVVWFFNYNGDPKAPHAELTGGLCSDGFVNSPPVFTDPETVECLASELVALLQSRNAIRPDWVVGSAYSAITFSYEVARQMRKHHGYAKKDPTDPKKMIWDHLVIPEGALVLQCEELITTLGTTLEVRRAIEAGNPNPVRFLPDVATVIYRPAHLGNVGIIDVIALVAREIKTWKPEECPLCKAGSQRLRPRQGQNWAKLIGRG